ncbi:MAG: methylenetetrahydrofolate reductase [Betaproteobacteria bacterium]|nr:methylenetetrahydrofolate reductase [Betaproteobacteria bacterium]
MKQDSDVHTEIDLKAVITSLFNSFSIEVTPREAARINDFREHVPEGTSVYVAWLQGSDISHTVDACVKLRSQGMVPVPHLAARAIPGPGQLEALLALFQREAAVEQVLLIGGGLKAPVGDFDCTMQVLETGLLQDYGIRKIGVAGHPEGSPDIDDGALAIALKQKNEYAQHTNTELYIVTQFFFDAAPVMAWEREIRSQGNRLAIHAGLHGLVSIATLIKYARNCGIGPSLRALTGRYGRVLALASERAPDELVAEIARSRLRDSGSRIENVHLFPFGSFKQTARWAGALSRGEFRLVDGGRQLSLLT